MATLHIPVDCFLLRQAMYPVREQHHYAKSILFSDCFSRELPKGRHRLVILICTMAMQLFVKIFLN